MPARAASRLMLALLVLGYVLPGERNSESECHRTRVHRDADD